MALPDIEVGDEVTADLLNSLPKGVVYQGNRTSTAGATSAGTELGLLRLDDMVLLSGRCYQVIANNPRPDLTTVTDRVKFTLRYNSAGTATTSSTEIGRSEIRNQEATTGFDINNFPQPMGWINPTSDTTTGSVMLSVARATGAGTVTVPPDTGGLWLTVIDHGMAVADTGVDV